MKPFPLLLAAGLFLLTSNPSGAAFDVSLLDLHSYTSDQTHVPTTNDFDDVTTTANPLHYIGDTVVGLNATHVQYDYSWDGPLATGSFNNFFTHSSRTANISQTSYQLVGLSTDAPLRVHFDGATTYSHTPGDEDYIFFRFAIVNVDANTFPLLIAREGGQLIGEPASGAIHINGKFDLLPGIRYRIESSLATDNLGDSSSPPTGTLDASGYMNFSLGPVPEPGTAILVAPLLLLPLRRSRRCATSHPRA